jgi:hypothetical protein
MSEVVEADALQFGPFSDRLEYELVKMVRRQKTTFGRG